jgi:hypothetical protein
LNWNDAIFLVIEVRTFSNIWYWLAVGVIWSTVSHWILGVPFDMIYRARREGAQSARDLEDLVAINVRRLATINEMAGLWLVGFAAFMLTAFAMLGFYYGFELAQGFFCLSFPLVFVGMLNMRASRRFQTNQPEGEALARALMRLRFWIQVIAMISIFFTAMYGMYFNLIEPPGL